jgi:inner membrane protein
MPSVGHIAVGLAARRVARTGFAPGAWTALLVGLSLLPDADVVAFALGIPYAAPFGHRGASHSLVFAALVGGACAAVAAAHGRPRMAVGLVATLVVASHGLLDTMTDGGLGVALLWPFSNERFFAPWRPIPVAPIGARLFSARGLDVILTELALFLPVLAVGLWPRSGASAAPRQ